MKKRACFLAFLMVVLVTASVGGIGYGVWASLAYRWSYPRFQINGTFSSEPAEFNKNSTVLRWDIDLSVTNPNGYVKFSYDNFQVLVYGDGVILAMKSIPSFRQGTRNTTLLHANVLKLVAQDFARSLLFDKDQSYEVRLKTVFTTDNSDDYGRRHNLLVYCDFLDNRGRGGEMKQCRAGAQDN